MTSGGQCVMTPGTTPMLLWFASSWDMHTLEVGRFYRSMSGSCHLTLMLVISYILQSVLHRFGDMPIYDINVCLYSHTCVSMSNCM